MTPLWPQGHDVKSVGGASGKSFVREDPTEGLVSSSSGCCCHWIWSAAATLYDHGDGDIAKAH